MDHVEQIIHGLEHDCQVMQDSIHNLDKDLKARDELIRQSESSMFEM